VDIQQFGAEKKELLNQFLDADEISKTLSDISERQSQSDSEDEKLKILAEFDKILKTNKEIIKEKYPNLLVSILNSL